MSLEKEPIDYETKALHFSAHMFFEKPEVKKALCSLVKQFAFKNQSESKKTARLHTVLSRKPNDSLIIEEETSESGLGFVDKFASLFIFEKKVDKFKQRIGVQHTHMFGETNCTIDQFPSPILSSKNYFYPL